MVSGATGSVGREVVSQLLDTGARVRALTRNPDRANLPAAVDVAHVDMSSPASLTGPLADVRSVFLVWPFTSPEAASEIAPAVVEAIAGVAQRIVYLSAEAAERRPESFWASLERLVERSRAEWTFLRPTGFAKNTLMWADQIRTTGVVRWPYAAAARSLIDERDVAAVAVRALTDDRHGRATYVLSGPATLTQAEQVQAIGEAIGRPLRFEEVSPEDVRPALVESLGDEPFADGALRTWAGFVDQPERTTSVVEEVVGRPAHSFLEWARYHADDFL